MIRSIIFLGTQMTIGGAQRLLFTQAQWFYQHGYDVTAVFFYDKDGVKDVWQSTYPFDVVDLGAWQPGSHPVRNGLLLIAGLFRLWLLLRRKSVDVIETFTPDSNVLGLLISRLAGVPVRIATHHGYIEGAGEWRKKVHGWIINSGFCQMLVAVSGRVKRMSTQEEGVKPGKIFVILNGIEIVQTPETWNREKYRETLGIRSDDFVYLTVSRLTVQKGHTYLLDAIPMVLDRFPENIHFLFAGEGHQRAILERKAIQLGLMNKVQFLGNREDIAELMSLADVFVLPSLWEGLPLALLEAMSVGLPVVATLVEGVETVITDGENGYLVPPKDVKSLASALIKMRDCPEIRQAFGKRNVDLIQREFTIDRMCAQYEKLFIESFQKDMVQ